MKTRIIIGIFIVTLLFSCSTNDNEKISNISVTITQTMQYQEVFPILNKADSILVSNMTIQEIQKEENKTKDTLLSMAERQAATQTLHPLTSFLYPNFIIRPNGEYLIASSSFIGYAFIKDTLKVNKSISNPTVEILFPKNIRFKWTKAIDIDSAFYLSAIYNDIEPLKLGMDDIEIITIERSGIFKESFVFRTNCALLGKTEFVVVLHLNEDGIEKLNDISDKTAILITVDLNGKKYHSSLTVENVLSGIIIGENIYQKDADSIKANYGGLIKEE